MIEDLTEEKLLLYEFPQEQIEKLLTWKNHSCSLSNNRGQFWASNVEGKIYSGNEAKEKQYAHSLLPTHYKEPKEKFESFEDLYRHAVLADSIQQPADMRERLLQKNEHKANFDWWLQDSKRWQYGDESGYKELLTRINWVEYLTNSQQKKERFEQKERTLKKLWRPSENLPNRSAYSTLDFALFHYYKQEGGYEPPFKKEGNKTKRDAIRVQAEKYKIGLESFVNNYYSIAGKKENRLIARNISHIEKAIGMLAEFPAAKKIAESELKEAELNS